MIETKLAQKESIQVLLNSAMTHGDCLVLWREPQQAYSNLIITSDLLELDEVELHELLAGFVIGPFLPDQKKYFARSEWYYQIKDNQVVHESLAAQEYPIEKSGTHKIITLHKQPKPVQPPNNYTQLVNQGIELIESGELEKVVPSRYMDISLAETFDALKMYQQLCERYPHALVSLHSSPKLGTWIGATPELLVSVDEHMTFKTVALAGTLPHQESTNLKSVAWTQKEIEEQAMVTRYIINCFKKIRLREYEEHGPKTVVAGNLLHLKTEYSVDMNAVNFPNLGSVMLKLLHPTSAVCGMPLQPAIQFLKKHEGYDRQLYSGYLGPVNIEGNTAIYVNLRCMQLFENAARLYAGAGVTIDSDANHELEETEMKMKTLLNIIQSAS